MKAKEVRAFKCAACNRLRLTAEKADACCTCPCGARVAPACIDRCVACGRRNSLRRARADVKRAKETLASRERRVAQLLAEMDRR